VQDAFISDLDHVDAYLAGIARGDFYRGLVPYQDDFWPGLSSHLSLAFFSQMKIPVLDWINPSSVPFTSLRKLEILKTVPSRDRYVTSFDALLRVFFHNNFEHMIGELQFSYCAFIGLSAYEGLQAWLGTVDLIANAWPPSSASQRDTVLTCFNAQLAIFPSALFDQADSKPLMINFRRMVKGLDLGSDLSQAAKAFVRFVSDVFGIESVEANDVDSDSENPPTVLTSFSTGGPPPLRLEFLKDSDDEEEEEEGVPSKRMSWMI